MLKRVCEYTGLNLKINTWSPADGWTKHELVQVVEESDDDKAGKAGEYDLSRYLKCGEMYEALYLLNAVYHAQAMKEKENEKQQDKKEVMATK